MAASAKTRVVIAFCFSAALLRLCCSARRINSTVANLQNEGLCKTLVQTYSSYGCREYVVRTDDGFLLGMQRFSSQNSTSLNKGPVLLYHGVLIGGDIWVLDSPQQSLPYILADAGYDVWIGNTRTTFFSYGHVNYKKQDQGFWDWSVDELAKYDLAAFLQQISGSTGGKAVNFIGYSEGTQAAFVALSQGQLREFMRKAVMLAPIAYLHHFTSPIGLAGIAIQLDKIYDALHIYEFSLTYRSPTGKQLLDYLCPNTINFCQENWVTLLTGPNCCLNNSRWEFYDKYELQDTAAKNMKHFAQQYRTKTFCKFDYGEKENMRRYQRSTPPPYELGKIDSQLPMLLINGGNDALSDATDVDRLLSELRGQPEHLFIPEYAHFDFVLGLNARDKLYSRIISFLEK